MDYWFSEHEIALLAADLESKGAAFYKQLQKIAGEAVIADMCAFFAGQEQEHQAKFLAIAEAHRTSEGKQCYSVDIGQMLRASMLDLTRLLDDKPSTAQRLTLVSDSLALAARVEATAISVYTKMTAEYTSRFSGVLMEVLEEERKHLKMIQQVQKRFFPSAA